MINAICVHEVAVALQHIIIRDPDDIARILIHGDLSALPQLDGKPSAIRIIQNYCLTCHAVYGEIATAF